jgi:thioredoxin 1
MRKKTIFQIAAVLIIGLLVVGVWVFKNNEETVVNPSAQNGDIAATVEPAIASDTAQKATTSPEAATTEAPAKANEDFVLEVEAIDLEQLLTYQLPIIIDFGSDSCIPCKAMAPVLQTMNAEMQGKAIIKFVDVWKHSSAADGFPIQVIPTQVFINADGTPYVPGENVDVEFTKYTYKDTGAHAFTVHQGGLTEDQMRAILVDMGVAK